MQNFGGQTKSITVFLKWSFKRSNCNGVITFDSHLTTALPIQENYT